MKKVLFISYFFPPIQSIESTMALNAAKYLARFGWQPTVIAAERAGALKINNDLLGLVPSELRVIRTNVSENFILHSLSSLKLIPDAELGWLPFAVREAKKIIAKEKFDAIISRANPISSHIAAIYLNRSLGLPVIGLFGDPWTENPYINFRHPLIKKINEAVERFIFKKLDKLVFTTKQTRAIIVNKYKNLPQEKVVVFPNTYDPEEFQEFIGIKSSRNNKFVITHTGSFYGLRSPEPFFKAVKEIFEAHEDWRDKIEIRLFGPLNEFEPMIKSYGLSSSIVFNKMIPRKEAIKELFNADLLFIVDAPSEKESIFLPGKLVDYLVTGKPILAVTPEQGASADVVRLTKTGSVVAPGDIEGIKKEIEYYFNTYLQSKDVYKGDKKAIEQFSAVNYGRFLSTILDSLLNK